MSQTHGEPQQGTCSRSLLSDDVNVELSNKVSVLSETETKSKSVNRCQNKCIEGTKDVSTDFNFSNIQTTNLEYLRKLNEQFLKDRNWHQFHSPRNVLLALVGEVGELAEILYNCGEISVNLYHQVLKFPFQVPQIKRAQMLFHCRELVISDVGTISSYESVGHSLNQLFEFIISPGYILFQLTLCHGSVSTSNGKGRYLKAYQFSQAEREHVGQEVSDILVYLIDFATRCHIDIPVAVANKMTANSFKYPIDKAYGKANKYTDYQ